MSEREIAEDIFLHLTPVTDHSSSVPPSCWWWITCTDHLLYARFRCISVLWAERPRWTAEAQGYSEEASDRVEWRGATAVYYNTPSRKRGDSVIQSNTWKKTKNCELNWAHFTTKKESVIVTSADFSEQMVLCWDLRRCLVCYNKIGREVNWCCMNVLVWCKSKKYSRQETKNQRQQDFSPKSPDSSTPTDLQPSWPLRSILVAAPLPPLLEPPVSRTWPGLTKQVAIPSPSTQTGVVRTLRAVVLNEMDGTGDTAAKQTHELQYCLLPAQGMGTLQHYFCCAIAVSATTANFTLKI